MTESSGPMDRRIYSVSELTEKIKSLLEEEFPFVWISGEISNFRIPVSGHYYFTLKDPSAQISAVMFRGQIRNLKFTPQDGMRITGLGRISLYAPRGTYQIIFEYIEPHGIGSLHVAFEQLKARLQAEGIFHPSLKRPIPPLPFTIGVVTSLTGAVLHDIIRVVTRRFPVATLVIAPTRVQGEGAEKEIVAALSLLNQKPDIDAGILARGGGSLEDLWPFNSEEVVRAIRASRFPIVTGIGHETDFTIADFAADLRAPTPSAAAEMIVPLLTDLQGAILTFRERLHRGITRGIQNARTQVGALSTRLVDPRKRLADSRMRLDEMTDRLVRAFRKHISHHRELLSWREDRLRANSPDRHLRRLRKELDFCCQTLCSLFQRRILTSRGALAQLAGKLEALSPLGILARGYSITRRIPDGTVITTAAAATVGNPVEILLHAGSLVCRIESIHHDSKTEL